MQNNIPGAKEMTDVRENLLFLIIFVDSDLTSLSFFCLKLEYDYDGYTFN